MYDRLTKIDDLTRPAHSFLEPEDACFYMGEYTAHGGFGASTTNGLIWNLKKPMARRANLQEWRHKVNAISEAARCFRRILKKVGVESSTFVPVPPSKRRGDLGYDDRIAQILDQMGEGFDCDAREIVYQHQSMAPSHEGERASIAELVANYRIDAALLQPPRNNRVVIVDDMLTTGRHFKAMTQVLSERFPGVAFRGLFIARRNTRSPLDEFDAIEEEG